MSFDRLARYYSWMEWLLAGRKLQRCRTAFLEEARNARDVLLVGEGHGRFLEALCRVNPTASVACLDASAKMLGVAKDRVRRAGLETNRIDFTSGSILSFEPKRSFDLVVTHFFLDCFEGRELERVIDKVARVLRPGGGWMVADFQVPQSGWRRHRARLILSVAYAFFRKTVNLPAGKLINPAPLLLQQGLNRISKRSFNQDLLYAEFWRKPA